MSDNLRISCEPLKLDIHLHGQAGLEHFEGLLHQLIEEVCKMAIDISKLQASLQKETDAETAVVKLLDTIAAALKAIPPSTDPVTQAAIDAMVAQVDTNTDKLAAAVVADTPSA